MSDTLLGSRVIARLVGEDYNHLVRTLPPEDLWGQVRRHAQGRPVGEDQIGLMVDAIQASLGLSQDDILLDLGCGNGVLSDRLAPACAGLHGVDVAGALVSIASAYFGAPPRITFATADIADYVWQEPDPDRFTKALFYGSFHHLTRYSAARTLETLTERFRNVRTVFIGNLPDLTPAQAVPPGSDPAEPDLFNPLTEIGICRTAEQLVALARQSGWRAEITTMPPAFYAAHHRYDAKLTRLRRPHRT